MGDGWPVAAWAGKNDDDGDGHPPLNRARVTVGAFCIGDRAFSASAPFKRVLIRELGIPWQSRSRQGTTRSVRNVEATRTWW